MHVLLQWAQPGATTPAGWQRVELARAVDVRNLPKQPLVGLVCQGIDFSGYDHLAIEAVSTDRLRITGWQDDPVDFGDTRWATRWDLSTPAPDARLGGAINTVQTRTVWATPDAAEWFGGYGPSVLQWSAFVPPAANLTRDGVWLPEATWEKHLQARTVHDWREWMIR
jgi:hypothetical protein